MCCWCDCVREREESRTSLLVSRQRRLYIETCARCAGSEEALYYVMLVFMIGTNLSSFLLLGIYAFVLVELREVRQ